MSISHMVANGKSVEKLLNFTKVVNLEKSLKAIEATSLGIFEISLVNFSELSL